MNGVNMNSITVKIPLATYGKLATAAALDGMDITAWTEAKVKAAAIRGALPAPAPSTPEPESKPHES